MNSAPICTALALSAVSGQSASATIACTDYDGDALTYSVKTQPPHGSVTQSGSTVTYVSTAGYVGADTFTLAASDGTTSTPISATVSVTAPVTTPPAATVSGAVTATSTSVSLGLACASGTAACSGTASLSATLSGQAYSLGAQGVTLAAGTTGRFAIAVPSATRTALRAYAGRTIPLAVAFTVTSSDGSQHTTTTTVQLVVAR